MHIVDVSRGRDAGFAVPLNKRRTGLSPGKKAATPALALRVARFAGVPMDELLAGQWLSPRVCPHCGHPPDDFADDETVVTERAPTGGLTILDGGRR